MRWELEAGLGGVNLMGMPYAVAANSITRVKLMGMPDAVAAKHHSRETHGV